MELEELEPLFFISELVEVTVLDLNLFSAKAESLSSSKETSSKLLGDAGGLTSISALEVRLDCGEFGDDLRLFMIGDVGVVRL